MKTAQQIYDLMIQEMPFEMPGGIHPYVIEAIKLYAQQVGTDTRKRCAKQATIKHTRTVAGVDKQSILDVEILTP